MIKDYQTGFIVGKNILEGITTAHEVIHRCKKTRGNKFLLKLDFENVYDTVSWDCLLEVLQLRGFEPRWLSWIVMWLNSAKTYISINGEVGKEIVLRRDLRQDDPLSPLLFVLVADGMNNMLIKVKKEGLVRGLSGTPQLLIINLQYADDTLISGKSNIREALILKWAFCC